MVKIKILRTCQDAETGIVLRRGDEIKVADERVTAFVKSGHGVVIDAPAPKTETKPKRRRKQVKRDEPTTDESG